MSTDTPTPDSAARPPKPTLTADDDSRPFFDAARDGTLLLRRCAECGTFALPFVWLGGGAGAPLRARCPECNADALEWAPSTGRGTIYSFAIMHQVYDPSVADDVPYNLTVVELEEGVRFTSNVVGVANEDLEVGMPVQVTFEPSGEVVVPKFGPAR